VSWLVFLRPVRAEMPVEPTEEESRIVDEHYEYLVRLRAKGKLMLAGPSHVAVGDTIGIEVYDVDDEAEVRAILAADPAIANGLMTAELRPLRVSVR
jgi:uncharacterized protein YciI